MIIVASGYFDPLHVGHVEYLKMARDLGDTLIVIVNNDAQAILKKGKPFMSQEDRLEIVRNLKPVSSVFLSVDQDSSVCLSIRKIHEQNPNMVFAKGGDRMSHEIPEAAVCGELGIKIVDGLGHKIRLLSELTLHTNTDQLPLIT